MPAVLQEGRGIYISEATIEAITAAVDALPLGEHDTVAIFLGEADRPDLGQLVDALNERDIEFFGGFFPGIIHGADVSSAGALVLSLPMLAPPILIRGLERPEIPLPAFPAFLTRSPPTKATALLFVDGLTTHISHFLSEVFKKLGSAVNYLGGGRGRSAFRRSPASSPARGCFATPQ